MTVEYRYKHRSFLGAIGFLIGLTIASAMLIAGSFGHWFWFLPGAFAVFATLCQALAFLRNSDQGCSVDESHLNWWRSGWPKMEDSIDLDDIIKIQLHTWGESNQIRIMKTDRTVVALDDGFVGAGRAIYDAVLAARPNVEGQVDGGYNW